MREKGVRTHFRKTFLRFAIGKGIQGGTVGRTGRSYCDTRENWRRNAQK